MNREMKTIKTPIDKHEVVLKSWITGREKRDLRRIFLEKTNIPTTGKTEEVKINAAETIEDAENKAIEMIIVSVNGKKEKILDEILDMKAGDYDFVVSEINKVSRETAFLA